jgi:hypothetical protein
LAQDLAADPTVLPAGPVKGGRSWDKVANGYLSKNPNSAARIVARLKRDHPKIAEALGRGEFRSARGVGHRGEAARGAADGQLNLLEFCLDASALTGFTFLNAC